MDLKGFRNMAATLVLGLMAAGVSAQTNKSDTTSVAKLERMLSRFHIGGYGEVALSRKAQVVPMRRKMRKVVNGNQKRRKVVRWNWSSSTSRSRLANMPTSVPVIWWCLWD